MSLWSFSVKRWQFTLVVFALLIATGLWALSSIPRAEDPSLKFPGSLVIVQYPGADPEDVERLVVDPIEDALSELEDIKRLNSSALDGLALIEIEFTYGTDPDRKYDEVVREINVVRPSLPADVFSLEIRQFTPGTVNIVQLALVSETADWRELAQAGREPRGADRDRARRAPRRDLGLSRARSARRDRPRAPRERARHARPGHRRRAGREREHPGRRGGRRPAPLQPQDLGQLRVARGDRRHRRRARGETRRAPARPRRGRLERRGGALPRALQRQARGVRHGEHEGQPERLRRARTRSTSACRSSRRACPRTSGSSAASTSRRTSTAGCRGCSSTSRSRSRSSP